ncbi:hypothetical protein TNCV_4808501 [Trichonephila clavipes]|nr:hypothetical protein TNCV_4808501 [Trichonephila clavipes]
MGLFQLTTRRVIRPTKGGTPHSLRNAALSACVSVVVYPPENVNVPQGVSPKQPTRVLWNLYQGECWQNASPDGNSWSTVMVSFCDVTVTKPSSDLSPNQLALRITCGTEMTFLRKENTILSMKCPVFVLLAPF